MGTKGQHKNPSRCSNRIQACIRACASVHRRMGESGGIEGGRATARPDLLHRVDVGAPVQQQPSDLDVIILRRDVEARATGLGRQKGVRRTAGQAGER